LNWQQSNIAKSQKEKAMKNAFENITNTIVSMVTAVVALIVKGLNITKESKVSAIVDACKHYNAIYRNIVTENPALTEPFSKDKDNMKECPLPISTNYVFGGNKAKKDKETGAIVEKEERALVLSYRNEESLYLTVSGVGGVCKFVVSRGKRVNKETKEISVYAKLEKYGRATADKKAVQSEDTFTFETKVENAAKEFIKARGFETCNVDKLFEQYKRTMYNRLVANVGNLEKAYALKGTDCYSANWLDALKNAPANTEKEETANTTDNGAKARIVKKASKKTAKN
jgi:hypothetical protein